MIITLKPVKQSRKNSETWPEFYTCRFLEPGIVSYEDVHAGIAMLTKETILKMMSSFKGKPIIDRRHKDVTEKDYDKYAVGYVTRVWYDDMINWACAEFILTNDDAKQSIKDGFRVSCAYDDVITGPGGEWHAISYKEEILGGVGNHIALVDEPRYEGGIITPVIECPMLVNSKQAFIKKTENSVTVKVVNAKYKGMFIQQESDGYLIVDPETGDIEGGPYKTEALAKKDIDKYGGKQNATNVRVKVVNESKAMEKYKGYTIKWDGYAFYIWSKDQSDVLDEAQSKEEARKYIDKLEKKNATKSHPQEEVVLNPLQRICNSCEYLCSNHCDVAGEGGEITLEYAGKRLLGLAMKCSAYEKDKEGRVNIVTVKTASKNK